MPAPADPNGSARPARKSGQLRTIGPRDAGEDQQRDEQSAKPANPRLCPRQKLRTDCLRSSVIARISSSGTRVSGPPGRSRRGRRRGEEDRFPCAHPWPNAPANRRHKLQAAIDQVQRLQAAEPEQQRRHRIDEADVDIGVERPASGDAVLPVEIEDRNRRRQRRDCRHPSSERAAAARNRFTFEHARRQAPLAGKSDWPQIQ